MRALTVVVIAAGLAIAIGTLLEPWFTIGSRGNKITFTPGEARVCNGPCTTVSTDGMSYDSTWLGLLGACNIAAALGAAACIGAGRMAQAGKRQLGSGMRAIKRAHLMVAALIGGGITAGTLITRPGEVAADVGVYVTLAGFAVCLAALSWLPDETTEEP